MNSNVLGILELDLIIPSKELDVLKTKITPRVPNTMNPVFESNTYVDANRVLELADLSLRKVLGALTAGIRPVKISYTDLGELMAVGTDGTCLRRKSDGLRLKDDSV